MSFIDLKYIIKSYVWSRFPKFRINFTKKYHLIEDDSHWQLMNYFNKDISPEFKVNFLMQAIEERDHALIFMRLHRFYNDQAYYFESPPRNIFYSGRDFFKFSQLCQIGEIDALNIFIGLHRYTKDITFKKEIAKIIKDEIGHSSTALNILFENKITWLKYKYLNAGKSVATLLVNIILGLVFIFIYLPLGLMTRLFRGFKRD